MGAFLLRFIPNTVYTGIVYMHFCTPASPALSLFFHQELMGNGSLSEEAMIELMKQQLGKQSH